METQRGRKRKRDESEDNGEEEGGEEASGKKKTKKLVRHKWLICISYANNLYQDISADDKKINDNIQAIEKRWKCNDKECTHPTGYCYPHPVLLKHIPLDFPKRNFWGTAMV